MLRRRWTVLYGLGFIVASGCGGDEPDRSLTPVTRDSAGVTIVENGGPPTEREFLAPFALDSVADWVVGEEEGEAADDPRLLDGVRDAHVLYDGSILIANGSTSQLRRFDARGAFVAQTGRRGQGPGEFEAFAIGDIFADGDTVLVADGMLMRTHVYDREVRFLETRRFTLTEAVTRPFLRGVFADGDWLVLGAADGGRLGGPPGTVIASASERDRVLYGAFYERDLPLPEYAPLYTAMKVDDARRVWLMRFRMPYDSTDRVWDVVDSEGRLLGTVHTPTNLAVLRVRRDAVLGLQRDSLGVERVVRFPIRARP